MDFVGKRYWFFAFSLLVLLPGVAFLIAAPGLRPGIDFSGGSALLVEFADPVEQTALRAELPRLGHGDVQVDRLTDGTFFLRAKAMTDAAKEQLLKDLETRLSPGGVRELSFDTVSPVVARETVVAAFYAVLAAAVGIFLYIWWAFRNVPSPFRYGAAAVIALVHDTVVVVGIFAILGKLAHVEVSTMFLVALLTVIGYSVNDTIVVFDRVRENVVQFQGRALEDNVNLSIAETLGRSINTSMTVVLALLALLLFGGPTIRVFLMTLLIGVVAGTYSSIGIAAPILVIWEKGDIPRAFRRLRGRRAVPVST